MSIIEEGSTMFKRQDGVPALAVVATALLGGWVVASAAGAQAAEVAGATETAQATQPTQAPQPAAPPTAEEARKFVEDAEARLLDLDVRTARADWIHNTFITDDTMILAA